MVKSEANKSTRQASPVKKADSKRSQSNIKKAADPVKSETNKSKRPASPEKKSTTHRSLSKDGPIAEAKTKTAGQSSR